MGSYAAGMTIKTAAVTVGVTATMLHIPVSDAVAGSSIGVRVPVGGQTVFIGGPDVTASGAAQGWALAAGDPPLYLDLDTGGKLRPSDDVVYGVVATGTQVVNVLSTGI